MVEGFEEEIARIQWELEEIESSMRKRPVAANESSWEDSEKEVQRNCPAEHEELTVQKELICLLEARV